MSKKCGYTGKKCTEHDCRFFQQFRGQNPMTGQEEDKWECVTVMMPILQLEIARQQKSTAAALESSRNVFQDAANNMVALEQQKLSMKAIGG